MVDLGYLWCTPERRVGKTRHHGEDASLSQISSFAAGFFRIVCIFESINLPVLLNSFGGLPRQNLSLLYVKGIEIWGERGEVVISF